MKENSTRKSRISLMLLALVVSLLALASPQASQAAGPGNNCIWRGVTNSDWSTASNWGACNSQAPGSGDTVAGFQSTAPNQPSITGLAVTLAGLTIPSGGTLTMDAASSLTVNGDISNSGTLDASGAISLKGDFTNNGTYTHKRLSGVTLNGTSTQSISGSADASFYDLTINNSTGVTVDSEQSVENSLTLISGHLTLNAHLNILGSASVAGGSASTMIVATGAGELRKHFSGAGTFDYPIGDGTNYSPMTIVVTSAGSGSYVGGHVTASKHPQNTSTTDFIDRYWTVSSDMTGMTYDATFTYVDGDINGTEANMFGGKHDGSWTLLNAVDTGANTFTGTGLDSFSDFSAGEETALAVTLEDFSAEFDGDDVIVSWSTVTELDNIGFNLYRSSNASGPEVQVNDEMIPSQAPGSGQGASYSYTDSDLNPSTVYYYWLEDVDLNGNTTMHGPVSTDSAASFANTTALTLQNMNGDSTSNDSPLFWLLGSTLLAGAGVVVYRRRKQ